MGNVAEQIKYCLKSMSKRRSIGGFSVILYRRKIRAAEQNVNQTDVVTLTRTVSPRCHENRLTRTFY